MHTFAPTAGRIPRVAGGMRQGSLRLAFAGGKPVPFEPSHGQTIAIHVSSLSAGLVKSLSAENLWKMFAHHEYVAVVRYGMVWRGVIGDWTSRISEDSTRSASTADSSSLRARPPVSRDTADKRCLSCLPCSV